MVQLLSNKLAFVTGAGSGIGRSTCHILKNHGAKVIAADCNLQAINETIKQMSSANVVTPLEIDVTSLDSIQNAISLIVKQYKTFPSIVVNSAGITRDCYLLKMTEKQFDDVLNVNLKGTFLITQQFAKAMIDHNISNGSIVNISSIVAKINSIGQTNYAASKAGVISLTKVASKEYAKFGIRVNAVLPGFIETPMTAQIPDEVKPNLLSQCPMGRMGQPHEVAEAIAFLASDKASYINGATLEVTGGI